MKIKFRKFPYPYKAAITVSNDIDLMEWETFAGIYNFLNTKKDTKFGPGLGLALSSSIFFYSIDSKTISYFTGISERKSVYAERIAGLIRAGVIDTLHSYGDWGTYGQADYGFNRKYAEQVLNELEKNSLKLRVWTNHGHDNSIQNISRGRSGRTYEQGDDPGSPAYHADLLDKYGVRYFWASSTNIPGQEFSNAGYALEVLRGKGSLNTWKENLRGRNKLFSEYECLDGRIREFFVRYRGEKKAVVENLPSQLSPATIDSLSAAGGCLIVYTHFGARMESDKVISNSPWLPDAFVGTMRYLAEKNAAGDIWVAPLAVLLDHNFLVNKTTLTVETDKQGTCARINFPAGAECPLPAGLSLEAEGQDAERLETLSAGGKRIRLEKIQAAGDKVVFRIPGAKIEFPII